MRPLCAARRRLLAPHYGQGGEEERQREKQTTSMGLQIPCTSKTCSKLCQHIGKADVAALCLRRCLQGMRKREGEKRIKKLTNAARCHFAFKVSFVDFYAFYYHADTHTHTYADRQAMSRLSLAATLAATATAAAAAVALPVLVMAKVASSLQGERQRREEGGGKYPSEI